MRRRFRLTPGGRYPHEPWFHIGTLEVTTTWLVVLGGIVGLLVFALAGGAWTGTNLALYPQGVYDGKVWTLLTWPFVTAISGSDVFWGVVTLFFFWYFGSDIELSALGKRRFLIMLTVWTLILGGLLLGISELTGIDEALYGLSMIEILVVLLWTAEWPTRMFFFNIPAWVVGLVIAGIQVISYLGDRRWTLLLVFLVGIVLCAIVARSFGMLTEYPWLPRVAMPHRRPKPPRQPRREFDPGRPTVVPGPWETPSSRPTHIPSRDEQRMDELLDKIHAHGTESLTDAERAELLELRARRRRHS